MSKYATQFVLVSDLQQVVRTARLHYAWTNPIVPKEIPRRGRHIRQVLIEIKHSGKFIRESF